MCLFIHSSNSTAQILLKGGWVGCHVLSLSGLDLNGRKSEREKKAVIGGSEVMFPGFYLIKLNASFSAEMWCRHLVAKLQVTFPFTPFWTNFHNIFFMMNDDEQLAMLSQS